MPDNTGLGAIYKRKYCLDDNLSRARHIVFKALSKAAVPPTLYPNMRDNALTLIRNAGAPC